MKSSEFIDKQIAYCPEFGSDSIRSSLELSSTAVIVGMLGVNHAGISDFVQQQPKKVWDRILNSSFDRRTYLKYISGDISDNNGKPLNNPSFNVLSLAMMSVLGDAHWSQRNAENRPPSDYSVFDSLACLAMSGAGVEWRRAMVIKNNFNGSELDYIKATNQNGKRTFSNFEGLLTEIDAALVLSDICIQQGWWLFTAPPMFEKYGEHKSDFLVIDQASNRVVGVQVKANPHEKDVEKYKDINGGVILVSGIDDLGNFKTYYDPSMPRGQRATSFAGSVVRACNIYNYQELEKKHSHLSAGFRVFRRSRYGDKKLQKERPNLFEKHQVKKAKILERLQRYM